MPKGYGTEIHLNTANKAVVAETHRCGGKLRPQVKYRRGTRQDGTKYLSRFLVGDPCPNEAVATLPGTPVKRRCAVHLNQG